MKSGTQGAVTALLVSGLAALVAAPGVAQLNRRGPSEKILVLPPVVEEARDSAFSIEFADLVRERLQLVSRFRITVIPKAQISEALQASGFPPNAILDMSTAQQLARFLSANALSIGQIRRGNGARQVELRVLDVNRSGASGAVRLVADPGQEIKKVAEGAADSIDVILRSAMQVRECDEQRSRGRLDDALKRAAEALKTFPQNGSAYLCIATVYEAQRKDDSVRVTLERAVRVDPRNGSAWERLARIYQQSGDSVQAAHAFRARLVVRPLDQQLRVAVAALYGQLGLVDSAVSVLDEGLEYNPTDLAVLEVKERICTEAGRWRCILQTLEQVSVIDTTRIDTVFFAKMIGAAQQSDDTALQVKWAREATQLHPNRADYWKALGDGLQKLGKNDSALTAFQHAYRLDSTDVNSALAVANARIDAKQIDSTTWSMLDMAARRGSEAERRLTALLMAKYGGELVQAGSWQRAIDVFERMLAVDSATAVRPSAAFQLGLAYFQVLNASYQAANRERRFTCEQADEWAQWLRRGKGYLTEGAPVNRNLANQFLGYYQQYEGLIPRVREILKCR